MAGKKQSKIKPPETWDEFLAQAWDRWRSMGADKVVPEACYKFQVGERVRYGSHAEGRVVEVHDEGRIIVIAVPDKGEHRGQPYDNRRDLPHIEWWIDLEPIEPEQPTHFRRERILTEYRQQNLWALLSTTYSRGLLDSPVYQRDYVWTLADKQRLIGSLFARNDIGKFVFLEHEHPEYQLEVVDGKQRLSAIREYYEGRFPYEGYTWHQLSWEDKRALLDPMVQIALLDAKHVSQADILWLFLSLNEGGVPQTPEHVAKVRALYDKVKNEEAAVTRGGT